MRIGILEKQGNESRLAFAQPAGWADLPCRIVPERQSLAVAAVAPQLVLAEQEAQQAELEEKRKEQERARKEQERRARAERRARRRAQRAAFTTD